MPHAKPTATKLKPPAATTTGKFAKQGLKVSTACEAGFTGKATISVSKREARKLGLKQATTLASKTLTCGASDSATTTLKALQEVATRTEQDQAGHHGHRQSDDGGRRDGHHQ